MRKEVTSKVKYCVHVEERKKLAQYPFSTLQKRTLIIGSLPARAKVYKTLATNPYRHRIYSAVESVNRFIQKYCTSWVQVRA